MVYRVLMPFIINDLSAFYLDYTKDILYIEPSNSFEREAVQSTIYDILIDLLCVLTPIIPHTTSEAYSYLPFKEAEDVMLLDMPKKVDFSYFKEISEALDVFMDYREIVLKELEEMRTRGVFGKSLEAIVYLTIKQSDKKHFDLLDVSLERLLIVSKVITEYGDDIKVRVEKYSGHTCVRCWNVKETLNDDGLCERCAKIIENIKG